jgi:hypothetical protein
VNIPALHKLILKGTQPVKPVSSAVAVMAILHPIAVSPGAMGAILLSVAAPTMAFGWFVLFSSQMIDKHKK